LKRKKKISFAKAKGSLPENKRRDVIIKSILRALRRYYLKKFNALTQFMKNKRHNQESYFNECLDIFTEYLSQRDRTQKSEFNKSDTVPNTSSIQFFLGSLFYPKVMNKIFREPEAVQKTSDVHNILYEYSNNQFQHLL
jgi:hypothetical protein